MPKPIAPQLRDTRDIIDGIVDDVWASIKLMTAFHSTLEEVVDGFDESRFEVDLDELEVRAGTVRADIKEAQDKLAELDGLTDSMQEWATKLESANDDANQY